MDVARLSVFPFAEHPSRSLHHFRGVGSDALAAECGLDQPALAQPEVALAHKQAIAKRLAVSL